MALNEIVNKLADFYGKIEDKRINEERFYIKARLEEKLSEIEKAIIPLESQEMSSDKEKQCLKEIRIGMERLKSLAEKLEDKFSIFVIGDGNVGKSTVVNTLLGQEKAKMKFDPMTWKVDVFFEEEQGEESEDTHKVQLVTYEPRGNKAVTLPYHEALQKIDEEEAKRNESIERIQKGIREKTEILNKVCKAKQIPYREVADKLEAYKERLWQDELYVSSIVEAKWPVKTNEILANFQIVDTPGLRQNRVESRLKESIQKYYEEADGIIWVLDINKIAMNSTRAYIKEIEEGLFTKGKACDEKRMIALLNRSDCIRTAEEKASIVSRAREMYADEFHAILPFSASQALKGRLEGNEEVLEVSGYKDLNEYIQDYFLKGAILSKTEKVLKEIQREEMKFQVMLSYYVEELTEGFKQYEEDNQKLMYAFDKLQTESQEQLNSMIMSYKHTVEAYIEKRTDSLLDVKGDKLFWLRERILNLPRLQSEVKELLEHVLTQVEHLQKEYIDSRGKRQLGEEALKDLIDELGLAQYFEELEANIQLEQQERSPIRKLIGNMNMVKKLVDAPVIENYKETLHESLQEVVIKINNEMNGKLKAALSQEEKQILKVRKWLVDEDLGQEHNRTNSLKVLKQVDEILAKQSRVSTVKEYIKGIGEREWNNTLTN